MFFVINGANGATFFFSAASFADWKKSLGFYRGVSWLAAIKKMVLLTAYPILKRKAKMTADEVVTELHEVLPGKIELSITDHDSAMISPTRDKVIIHHHGKSFMKFAVGKSMDGVGRELEFYQSLAKNPPQHFCVSPLLDGKKEKDFVSLEMAYLPPRKGQGRRVPLAAFAEFFALKREPDAAWSTLWNRLALPCEIPPEYREGTTPVGMVHNDFKPWNVNSGTVPQFFDFESVSAGLPLTDLFNETVDPALHFGSVRECVRILRERHVFERARKLLTMQNIAPQEVDRYWKWYLLERYDHFTKAGDSALAGKFFALSCEDLHREVSFVQSLAALSGITLFAGAIRLWYIWHHPLETNDGTTYLAMLRRWGETGNCDFLTIRPPLFFYLAQQLTRLGCPVEDATLIVNWIAGTLLVIPVYLTARALWRKHSSGIAAAFFCAVMPKLVKFSSVRLRDGLYLFFVGWVFALWALTFRSPSKSRSALYAMLCGVVAAAGMMCRYEMAALLIWIVLSLPVIALCEQKSWERAFLLPVLVGVGVVVGVLALSSLPGMPDVWQAYLGRLQMHFWSWKIWGLR